MPPLHVVHSSISDNAERRKLNWLPRRLPETNGLHQACPQWLAPVLAAALIAGCGSAPSAHSGDAAVSDARTLPEAATCQASAAMPAPPRAVRMAAAARQEHALWGNALIDAEGRLTKSGAVEAEDEPRDGPDALAPWQRVLGYWRGVDPVANRLPYVLRYGAWRPADRGRLQTDLTHMETMGDQASPFGGLQAARLSPGSLAALRVAVDRVAVVDTPWSAAFISWLARQAGLVEGEFVFSEAHADYARAAYLTRAREAAGVQGERQVLRACPLNRTPPRMGDLVCHARARASDLDTFDALGAELTDSTFGNSGVPMHCDIVVAVDSTGFDAMGGNVLQAVTQRRLAFATGTSLLDASYQPGTCQSSGPACLERHMSQQPWTLLLQWR